ncbi:dehydrogenase [ubiquinone] 1 beta subcomplex subunit 7 [Seminavis robusta]|uniref:NADH dehydrogenase [ubiquinone] 1 beta subcomplex subunit 7 n=1 Tax=Seminavis robusta TaxID=568900 RepID=A0A9N8E277_9STRA|nr:dehydrogenase [ubiquinone] 1 beta subcomplex subunit 7 [Seminavis robusta]|eukprot:Sro542_g163320.1 dehydrogenase [ubiquinone] 1 beta subcomplex subunit 7 (93) ;mRNA; r:14604-14882
MGGHHHSPEAMPRKDQDLDAIKKAKIPLGYRDTCSHLLIQLNECRRQTYFNPHQCSHQRHTYEECQYISWLQRVEDKKEHVAKMKAAAALEG